MEMNKNVLLQKCHEIIKAAMAEWLRRWTWNPLGYARTGSNPVDSDFVLEFDF